MSTHTIDMTTIEPLPEAVAMQKALEALEAAEVDLYPRDVQPTNVVRNRIQFAAFVVRNHLKTAPADPTAAYAEGRGDQYEDDCAAVRRLLEELDDADELSGGRINTTRVREMLAHFERAAVGAA